MFLDEVENLPVEIQQMLLRAMEERRYRPVGGRKAQLGMPDMRLPIQYAFSYPERVKSSFERLDFARITDLNFVTVI